MNLRDYLAKDTLANIAKGRYSKEKVEDIFRKAVCGAANTAEHLAFEFAMLLVLQTLHYDFGFGAKRLDRFVSAVQPQLTAFDVGAYDMDDMRQALIEDAHAVLNDDMNYGIEFVWGKKNGEKTKSESDEIRDI